MSSLLISEKDREVHITLNRPEALNALSHEMVLGVTDALRKYEYDPAIEKIIFKGAGDRAFCAGGDIKSVYFAGRENPKTAWQYFRDEYDMNNFIHHYPKPITSTCHGFVMGGGYGIAGNGSEIITDETTKFAMPETGIGFFPDVGIAWQLSRAGALGMYVALTGDVYDGNVLKDIFNHKDNSHDEMKNIFSQNTLEDIFHALQNSNTDFAKETLHTLQTRSPISLHVTFRHLQMARHETFDQVIERDYQLACAFFAENEVYEGIRAAVVDKDRQPKWQHSSIFNVSMSDIDYYFRFSDHIE
jgi:enoyl-CoA hydratase